MKLFWSSDVKAVQNKNLSPYCFFEESTDPIAIYDVDFRLVMVNRSFSDMYDLPVDELIGRLCYQVLYNRKSICDKCPLEDVFRVGKPKIWEENINRTKGSSSNYRIQANPVKNKEGITVFVVQQRHDVTSQKLLEDQNKKTEEKYRTLVEMAKDGVFVLDQQGKITFANKQLADMLGYEAGEISGYALFDLMEDNAFVDANIKSGSNGLVDVQKVELLKKDGHHLPVRISMSSLRGGGDFVGSVGIVEDISYLKSVEASNRSVREFSKKIINSIPDSFVVIDPKTYRIMEANDHFIQRVGQDYTRILQKTCYAVLRGLNSPCPTYGIDCPVRETALKNQAATAERVYSDAEGRDRILQISTYPLQDSQKKMNLVIRLEHDITAKRKMEEILASRTRELEKANRKLKTLFDMSKQLTAAESLTDLINNIFRTSLKIFPDIEPVFMLLNAEMDGFLPLDSCDSGLSKSLQKIIKRLEKKAMLAGFIIFLNELKDSEIIKFEDRSMPDEVRRIFQGYASGFGLPIFVRQQCIGYFQICSTRKRQYDPEDLQFFRALFTQIAGHTRRLILHLAEINKLRQQVVGRVSFGEIIGQSQVMQRVYNKINLVADSDATVLITGENGTGKELVAQAIHRIGRRRGGPFVVANCAAYTPTLLESEIFGHDKGAFTGAVQQKKGRIERANGGTLFLDEIGNVSLASQAMLLRFLQNRDFERVGGETTIQADVRVLSATNRNLQEDVQAGRFRSDFYYRLNVLVLHLPPLRERKEDIPLLTQHFLAKHALIEGKKVPNFDPDDMHLLVDYHWPGNVRQLENAVSHAVIMTQGSVCNRNHLPKFLVQGAGESVTDSLAENERLLILRVLQECKGNKHAAAKHLKISRSTLYSKIQRHRLSEI